MPSPEERPWRASVDEREAVIVTDGTELDLRSAPDGSYTLFAPSGKTHRVEVDEIDLRARTLTLRLDGRRHRVTLQSPLDQLVDALGLEAEPVPELGEVRAPMPGLVLRVPVAEGDEVAAGQTLLVLEAMKMENAVKAPAAGTVQAVAVSEGQAVEKGALLVSF